MRNNKIRLTESQIHSLIKKTLFKVLNESQEISDEEYEIMRRLETLMKRIGNVFSKLYNETEKQIGDIDLTKYKPITIHIENATDLLYKAYDNIHEVIIDYYKNK